jgi:Fe-S oxidoreductase
MLESFAWDLHRCAVCHDQCLFATAEVFAAGKQTLATSRKAMLIDAVRRGHLTWSPPLVDVVYAGLSSGVQHAVCVHRGDPDGWPDESTYVWAARAAIVDSGMAPAWAQQVRERWHQTGDPYGQSEPSTIHNGQQTAFFFDSASRAFTPESRHRWLEVAESLGLNADSITTGSSGFELYDLGFVNEARMAAKELHRHISPLGAVTLVSDSPEAVYMLRHAWPQWGLKLAGSILHVSEWLDRLLESRTLRLDASGPKFTFHDPAYLARYLGNKQSPRRLLLRLGVGLVEMLRHGIEAPPSGSFYGAAVGDWVFRIASERIASAQAIGAEGIIVASPFDCRNLQGALPVIDLSQLALERLSHIKPEPLG